MSAATDGLLRAEVERFGYAFQLTPREREVLALLVAGHGNVPAIAEHLGLSTNTVHNHFKNIFKRTRTRTKTGLMALFIERRLDHSPGSVRRVPNVLLVEPHPDLGEALQIGLGELGMRVYVEPRATRALERVSELELDAIVVDPMHHSLDGDGPIALVDQLYCGHPAVLFAWPGRERAESGPMVRGHELPRDIDGLAVAILGHCTSARYVRSRPVRLDTALPAELCRRSGGERRVHDARVENLGPGGAYVTIAGGTIAALPSVGERVTLEVELEERGGHLFDADVVWVREDGGRAGTGLRFCDLAGTCRNALIAYCRSRTQRRAS